MSQFYLQKLFLFKFNRKFPVGLIAVASHLSVTLVVAPAVAPVHSFRDSSPGRRYFSPIMSKQAGKNIFILAGVSPT